MHFVLRERTNWMRLQSHTVVFDRDPDYERYRNDPTGVVMRILHIWIAECPADSSTIRAYLGSIRFAGTWFSWTELIRLFRRAAAAARSMDEGPACVRRRLSEILRKHFGLSE